MAGLLKKLRVSRACYQGEDGSGDKEVLKGFYIHFPCQSLTDSTQDLVIR